MKNPLIAAIIFYHSKAEVLDIFWQCATLLTLYCRWKIGILESLALAYHQIERRSDHHGGYIHYGLLKWSELQDQ